MVLYRNPPNKLPKSWVGRIGESGTPNNKPGGGREANLRYRKVSRKPASAWKMC